MSHRRIARVDERSLSARLLEKRFKVAMRNERRELRPPPLALGPADPAHDPVAESIFDVTGTSASIERSSPFLANVPQSLNHEHFLTVVVLW